MEPPMIAPCIRACDMHGSAMLTRTLVAFAGRPSAEAGELDEAQGYSR